MKQILFIVGSPKKNSFNKQFSRYAYEYLKDKAKIDYLSYEHLPLMSPDREHPRPKEVDDIMEKVASSDGIWIFASEYNLGYCAALKNLLDWLSRPVKNDDFDLGTHVQGKLVTISSVAGKSRGAFVLAKLDELLKYIGMNVVEMKTGVGLDKQDFIDDCPRFTQSDLASLYQQADIFWDRILEVNKNEL